MQFQSDELEAQFNSPKLNGLLKSIATNIDEVSKEVFGKDLFVTSIYRTPEYDKQLGGTGIHCLYRAIDFAAPSWNDTTTANLADRANSLYRYDPLRIWLPVALYRPHESATGPHLHLQVCSRTKLR
jgi:hypothetical protein